MTPPISIDGTDITGATIDGTDVTEITVDGDTVFSAESLPVAYSNLVAWYPFDSATYGGSNADDVTALFNPGQSGDSTGFDGTVSGATYQGSAGVKDINAGPNSGAFDFDGSDDNIGLGQNTFDFLNGNQCSFSFWFKADSVSSDQFIYDQKGAIRMEVTSNAELKVFVTGSSSSALGTSVSANTFFHGVMTYDGGNTQKLYLDGVLEETGGGSMFDLTVLNGPVNIGSADNNADVFDGVIDDLRIYDKELTASEVSDIYVRSEP